MACPALPLGTSTALSRGIICGTVYPWLKETACCRLSAACYNVTMEWHARIHIDPAILAGKPVIKGTRLSVEFVVGLLAQGWTREEIVRSYPRISFDDILACLAYAQERLASERVYPTAT